MKPEIKKRLEMIRRGEVPAGYKKTKVGIIPDEWEVIQLENIIKVASGEALTQKNIKFGKYPVYGGNGISGYHNNYNIDANCIVIGRVGAQCGNIYYVKVKFWITDNALYIKEKLKQYNDEFMYYKLKLLDLNKYADKNAQPLISGAKIYGLKITIPKTNEQIDIANILVICDRVIEKHEKLIELKKEQKKGLAHKLLTGKIRIQNCVSDVKKVKLKGHIEEFAERNKGNKISRILSVTNDRGFIEQSEQFERQVASKDITGYKVIKKNYFGYNPSRVNVGSLDLLKNYDDGVLSPIYVIFRAIESKLLTQYLYQFLKSDEFSGQLKNLLQGSVRNSLSFNSLEDVKLFIPKLNEQKVIAEILTTADHEIELLEKELEMIKEQKKALMELLLTGIVRVK